MYGKSTMLCADDISTFEIDFTIQPDAVGSCGSALCAASDRCIASSEVFDSWEEAVDLAGLVARTHPAERVTQIMIHGIVRSDEVSDQEHVTLVDTFGAETPGSAFNRDLNIILQNIE